MVIITCIRIVMFQFSSEQAIEENRLAILSDVRREQHVAQEKLKSMRADVKRMETETTRA